MTTCVLNLSPAVVDPIICNDALHCSARGGDCTLTVVALGSDIRREGTIAITVEIGPGPLNPAGAYVRGFEHGLDFLPVVLAVFIVTVMRRLLFL